MTNELREKISLLAHLIQHATAKDYGTYLELDDWFYEYTQAASPEEKRELQREMKKLFPTIHTTLVEITSAHEGTELAKQSQTLLERMLKNKGGNSN